MEKILFGITGLTLGGAERVLVDIANNLCDKYEITIFTIYAKGELEKQLKPQVKLKSLYKEQYKNLPEFKRKYIAPLRVLLFKNQIYKKYIKENLNDISIDMLSKYQVKDQNEYNEYMCVDKNGRYYIFNVTSAMNYTLFLDTYTVDLPEFIEEYNSASNQKKMALNINKIISAINQKDYEYVYSKLDETFKQNYYNNQESLEAFIKENLFNKNKASFQEYSSEQNLGIYKVRIEKEYQDGEQAPEGKNAEFQNLNIIMKLGQGTDFVMSFSIGE